MNKILLVFISLAVWTMGSIHGQTPPPPPAGSKALHLTLMLEGLYNSSTGMMNKANDYVGSAIVSKFAGTVADQITVELHSSTAYATVVYTASNVNLLQNGTCVVYIPSSYAGTYYITVKHRNHLTTVSAAPVSFAPASITYNFTSAASQAYGSNMKEVATGKWGLYAGDVNQDGIINLYDRQQLRDNINLATMGYVSSDVNGTGIVDFFDRLLIVDALAASVTMQTPN